MDTSGTPSTSPSTPSTSAAVPGSRAGRRADIAVRILQVILALVYVGAAVPKLMAQSAAADSFGQIGFGMWFMYVIGILEIAGAVALVTPWLSGLAALALIGLMAGAFLTQLTVFHGHDALVPLLLVVPLAVVAWFRRGTVVQLPALLRGLVSGR